MTLRRIGDLIELQRRWIDVDPLETYQEIGVRSFGKGIFHKEPLTGDVLGNKRVLWIEPGDLVFNNFFAWEGAVAMACEAERGLCGSHRFMTYAARTEEVDLEWLRYFFVSEPGLWLLRKASPGSAGRNRTLAIDRFEALEIPLSPIDDQRRVVATIDGLDALVNPIRERAARISKLGASLVSASASGSESGGCESPDGWRRITLGEVISAAADPVSVEPMTEYANVGVFSFARGLFKKPPIDGSNTSARTLYRIRSGQFIYSRLFAFEGAYASVPDRFDGYFVSNEFPAFDVDADQADVGFLTAYFSTSGVWERVAEGSKGLGVRRQRVQQAQLLAHVVWLPPLAEQRRIGRIAETLRKVGRRRTKASTLVDAIKPAALNRAFAGLM